jgi:transposase
MSKKESAESVVREIRRKNRKKYSAEEKIRTVLEGLRGEESIAALCRLERINPNLAFQSIFHKMEFQSELAIPNLI